MNTLKELITEITNQKVLELYRQCSSITINVAKEKDDNLTDLATRIIDALDLESNADHKYKPSVPIETEKSPRDKSQTPIGSGELDTKKSNESPAIDQHQRAEPDPEPDRVDDGSGSAVSGADPDPLRLTTSLRVFKNAHHMSNANIAKLAGVSDMTIGAIIKGDHVSAKSRDKVLAAIADYKPKGEQAKKPEPEKANGIGDRPPAEFLQATLQALLDAEDLDPASAAGALMIQEHSIRSILAGHLPHSNIIFQLAKFIPEINANHAILLAAAEQNEAA